MQKHHLYDQVKRSIDIATSLFLLVILIPLWVILALLVKSDGGPIFFRQPRVGRDGHLFQMWKFRSMIPDADAHLQWMLERDEAMREQWEVWRKVQNDPRTTPIGVWLRRLSLDELPQLWNVLKGDMSLVGPRPILTNEVTLWGSSISSYESVRPGITGLWQVSGRSHLSYEERIALDLRYIEHRSWWLDTVIVIRTVGVVLMSVGAH
jgi:lipopolysaccharide/colanic/teichoic acid biosynthesis glycosyltransferase